MAMKYVAAYLMCVLGGKESPSAADVTKTLVAVGAEVEEETLKLLISKMEGKTAHEVISSGMEKLQQVPAGGAAVAASSGAAPASAASAKAEEKPEPESEEEDVDMGLSLFG